MVYLTLFHLQMNRRIQEYFERFGEVETVRIHSRDDFYYGFVQFKMEECAKAALSMKSHRIGNCFVKVKEADFWHQPPVDQGPPNPLLTPPEQDSPHQILNKLDDDCLRVVFQFLNLNDLCNAAEACTRFNKQAKDAFSMKYKNLNMAEFKLKNENQIDSLLKNFGPMIVSLKVSSYRFEDICRGDDFLLKIQTKCENLKDLSLEGFSDFGQLQPLFAKLERLALEYCEFDHRMTDLLGVCKKLKKLCLDSCETESTAYITQNFPMLEEACLNDLENLSEDVMNGFVTSNPTLEKLKILCFSKTFTTRWFSSIGQHLPNLKELEIFEDDCTIVGNFQEDIKFLGQLKSLQLLEIVLSSNPVEPLITSLVTNETPIQRLVLRNGVIDDKAVDGLLQLKQIKVLNLSKISNLSEENLIDIAKELPELEELYLFEVPDEIGTIAIKKVVKHAKKLLVLRLASMQGIEIDVDDYIAILKNVQSRPEKIKLMIEVVSDGDKVDVPEEMMNANREWLHIDETISVEHSISNDSEYINFDDLIDMLPYNNLGSDYFDRFDFDMDYFEMDSDSDDIGYMGRYYIR